MNFATLPRLPNIEEIINTLFQTSNKEEAYFKITQNNKLASDLRKKVEEEVEGSVKEIESES